MDDVKCFKSTGYSCTCQRCREEFEVKAVAHTAHVNAMREKAKTEIASYWTGNFSHEEKTMTVSHLRAGYEEPLVRCNKCKAMYDRRTGGYEAGLYSFCEKCLKQ